MSWVMRAGRLVAKGGPEDVRPYIARSGLPCPMVISDTLADVVNPINGKPYDSKSQYYEAVKAADCEILGNDTVPNRDNETDPIPGIEADISTAMTSLGG